MATYAVLDGGQVVSWREIADWNSYPAHKKSATDEKGDGGPVLRPRVIEGEGPQEQIIIEPTQVRVVRSMPAPPPPLEPTKPNLLVAAQSKRRFLEVGGTTISGVPVYTDPESQAKLHAARTAAKEDAGYTVKWKTAAGTFATLNAATIIALADGVRVHVQSCFAAEEAVAAKINNNTYTTFAQVDAASEWPTV